MADVIVVAAHLPGDTPFTSQQWTVDAAEIHGDFDYARALGRAWASENVVVNVEHDMQVNDDLIAALVACPHKLCAWAYLVYEASGIWNPPAYPFTDDHGGWITEGVEWATWAAPGFIKVHPDARGRVFPDKHWLSVEDGVNGVVKQRRWHIHWPAVEHYHQ